MLRLTRSDLEKLKVGDIIHFAYFNDKEDYKPCLLISNIEIKSKKHTYTGSKKYRFDRIEKPMTRSITINWTWDKNGFQPLQNKEYKYLQIWKDE